MELYKLKTEELRGYDAAKLRETEKDIRKQLADIRMDIYSAPTKYTGKIRGLRRTLARVLTLRHASLVSSSNVGAPKAAKKAPVAKAKAPAKVNKTTANKK